MATATVAYAAGVPNGDFSNGLNNWTIVTVSTDPADFVNLGVTELVPGCGASPDYQDYTVMGPWGDPPPNEDDSQPDDMIQEASVVSFTPPDGVAKTAMELYSDINYTATGYDVVHGPAAVSDQFSAVSGDIIYFDWYASDASDNFAVTAYIQNTDTCDSYPVLVATGVDPTDMTPSGSGANDWQQAYTTIPANGNYRFVFVSGTYDASGGQAAGAYLYIANIYAGVNFFQEPGQTPPPWLQAYGRADSSVSCEDGWNPSWAEWPGDGSGGYTCERHLAWISSGIGGWGEHGGFPS
ncbi:MAG: hypothetical protein GC156_13840 [Actinomycetales bacterium]|nr:hypothetical protein [Actinomycetales bacterium]